MREGRVLSDAGAPARTGAEETVRITSLALGGDAVGRLAEGRVVFVRGALPGELARVRVTRLKRQHAEGEAVEILEAAPDRVAPRCRHFGVCGGCRHQDLAYGSQLVWKTRQVAETLERIGGLSGVEVRPAIGMDDPWLYRNKMEFGISGRPGAPVIGLRQRGRFDAVFDLEECPIFSPHAGALAAAVEAHAVAAGYTVYDPHRHEGFLRHLVVRQSKNESDLLVALVTSPGQLDAEALVRAVGSVAPVTSTWHVETRSRANVVDYGQVRLLAGAARIAERLGPVLFEFGPEAFFQTNTRMAEVLYAEVRRAAALTGSESVLDLYCGIGAFAIYLAPDAGRVVGLEAVAAAVEDARHNAALNGVRNAEFVVADDRDGFPRELARLAPRSVQLVLLDPPRGGVHPRALQAVLRLEAPRVLYVSCNPASLARDLARLTESYEVRAVQPFDLFPHTPHIETLVTLQRRTG